MDEEEIEDVEDEELEEAPEASEPTEATPPEPAEEVEADQDVEPEPAPLSVEAQIEQRAKDLGMAIVRPETLAMKLRESLVEIVGPEAAVSYHLGAELKDGEIKFQLSRLGPHLLARLTADADRAAIDVAYTKTTESGWRIGVGVTASRDFKAPKGSELAASFAVIVSR